MSSATYPPTIFILGTRQHVGKTVTSVGVIAKLLSPEYGYTVDEIGYIKPVGQQAVPVINEQGQEIQVDKDAVLVTTLLDIQVPRYEITSPVIWEGGLTADFIDDQTSPSPTMGPDHFCDRIRLAYEEVAQGKKVVIVEGTGQPGVGSIGGICNADVINMLRDMGVPLYVLMVTKAGIGSTIDELFPYLIAMDRMGTRIDSIIINRVFPFKLDKVQHYLETYYTQLFPRQYGHLLTQPVPPIAGFVPMVPELRMFSMRLITQMFREEKVGTVEVLAPSNFDEAGVRLVRDVKAINLRFGYERFVEPGDAIIIGVNANDIVLSGLLLHERLLRNSGEGLSGLILSSNQIGGLSKQVQHLIQDERLPTITVPYDSAEIVQKIGSWTVKIQPYDLEKRKLISDTYCQALDLSHILEPRRAGAPAH
jgi:hypothetical protein